MFYVKQQVPKISLTGIKFNKRNKKGIPETQYIAFGNAFPL